MSKNVNVQSRAHTEIQSNLADKVLSKMTVEEKIGQCLTMVFRGSLITPSVIETITRLNVGGLRIEPIFIESAMRKYYDHDTTTENYEKPDGYFKISETYFSPSDPAFNITATEYARRLNKLKEIAMNRPCGVPLHITTDFEGDFSHDFPFDRINIFPANMGIRAAGEPKLAYKVGFAIAKQLSAIGVNMIHSPLCDVNNNSGNPEIGIRSFSDDPEVCCKYLAYFWEGLEDGGLIATAKHFPGRGDSETDAHHVLPVLNVSRERMDKMELAPYRLLIAKGLRAIMIAHSSYPAMDESGKPATLSSKILKDVLRGELGFEGVITTDAMGMGAIATKYGVPTACAMSLKAGCDLVLPKFEGELRSQIFFEIKRWIDEGRLTEEELDDRVRRVLKMKVDQGLFENGGIVEPEKASETLQRSDFIELSHDVASKSIIVLRDNESLLPLSRASRVMVVEQVMPRSELVPNNMYFHNYMFNEAVLGETLNVVNVTTEFCAEQEERQMVLCLSDQVDIILVTNYYTRYWLQNNTDLVKELVKRKKKVVVVTNTPYPSGATTEAGTVICTFGSAPDSVRSCVDVLYGKYKACGTWPLEHTKP